MKFGHLILKKIIKFVAHQMSDFKGKKGSGREREGWGMEQWGKGEMGGDCSCVHPLK